MNGLTLILTIILILGGFCLTIFTSRRKPVDTFFDLSDEEDPEDQINFDNHRAGLTKKRNSITDLIAAGLFTAKEQKAFLQQQKVLPFYTTAAAVIFMPIFCEATVLSLLAACVLGLCGGYLISRRKLGMLENRYSSKIDCFLPVVMERLVMAVQSGLDIISAMTTVVRLSEEDKDESLSDEPVTRLLATALRLTESGVPFEQALRETAKTVNSKALRHAFIHLALAHKEGGELVAPLKELSNSTQLYYQETIEEEIAKMPVKATVPLVLVFAGLIIIFITSPIMQIMKMSSEAAIGGF